MDIESLVLLSIAIVAIGLVWIYFRRNDRQQDNAQLLEALGEINTVLEKGGHKLELVNEPDGGVKFVNTKTWSDEEINRKKKQDGEGVFNAIGGNLFTDPSNEAKQLLAFLDNISQTYNGKRVETPMDAGQVWFGCITLLSDEPDSELARKFKILNEAWSATRRDDKI